MLVALKITLRLCAQALQDNQAIVREIEQDVRGGHSHWTADAAEGVYDTAVATEQLLNALVRMYLRTV